MLGTSILGILGISLFKGKIIKNDLPLPKEMVAKYKDSRILTVEKSNIIDYVYLHMEDKYDSIKSSGAICKTESYLEHYKGVWISLEYSYNRSIELNNHTNYDMKASLEHHINKYYIKADKDDYLSYG